MNAIDLLKKDHNFVEGLFQKIESTPPSRHAATIKKIKDELDTHATVEEKVFYPALKAKGNKELEDITMEAFEEHAQVKKFLQEISRSTSTEKREAKLKVLIEDVRHHVKEEEGEMFSLVEDQFSSEELEKLGEKMEAEKKKFRKAKNIPARLAEKAESASFLDKAREFVATALGGESPSEETKAQQSRGKASKASANGASRGNSGNSGKTSSGSRTGKSSSGSGTQKKASSSASSKAAKAGSASGKTSSSASRSGAGKASSGGSNGGAKKAGSGTGNGGSRKASTGSSSGANTARKGSGSKATGGGTRSKASTK